MKVLKFTDKGGRQVNQDFIKYEVLDDTSVIAVVADGMGGYDNGEVASQFVANEIVEFVKQYHNQKHPFEILKEAIKNADYALELKRLAMGSKRMGTVVVMAYIKDNKGYLAWVGDSRIYQFRDNEEIFVTKDHSMVNELLKVKSIKPADVEQYGNIVTRSIMGDGVDCTPDLKEIDLMPGDSLILCTDGLHKDFDVTHLVRTEEAAMERIQSTLDRFSDNVSFLKLTMN